MAKSMNNTKTNRNLPEWLRCIPDTEGTKRENWPPRAKDHSIDWKYPTFEVYHDPEARFTPLFLGARKKLDYSYHHNPANVRQELQDVIIRRVVDAVNTLDSTSTAEKQQRDQAVTVTANNVRRPWLVFSAGPMGVGKGYVLSTLNEKMLFPLDQFLKIDPDMLKSELPEMAGYLQNDPASAATKLHRESTQMADVLLEYALQARLPTLVDGSLRDVEYYRTFMERIRTDFPEYQLAILHVTASADIIRDRAQSRAEKTGREVPTKLLEESISQVPKSVEALSPFVDIVYTISNEDNQPVQLIQHGTNDDDDNTNETQHLSWETFRNTWWRDVASSDNDNQELLRDLPTWCESQCPGICHMQTCFTDASQHEKAKNVWSQAYPSFCPRCTLASDAQCGICIHDTHLCACAECGRP